jgi:hypothetical protein
VVDELQSSFLALNNEFANSAYHTFVTAEKSSSPRPSASAR